MRCSNNSSVPAVWLALILLAGCGTAASGPVLSGNGQPAPAFGKALPFPVDRELSALSTTTIDGKDAVQRSAGAADQGTSIMLSATAGPEYAVYTFNPQNTPNQVSVTIDSGLTSAYWIALANYTKNRWELDGPFASTQSFALGAAHLSPLGNFSVAVLAPPNETVLLDMLQLSANNDPPVADLVASADGPAPLSVNFDAGASTDLEGPIAQYEWEYESGGGFVSTGTTAVSNHDYLLQGTYTARVRVTDAGGLIDIASVVVNATAPVNDPPNAVLTAPNKQAAPFMAVFDASTSNDPDGTIVNYSWDLDNDGTYGEAGAEAAIEGDDSYSVNITLPGSTTVSVEVTDDFGGLGGKDTATATAIATGWNIFTFSSEGDETGRLNDLKIINGKPAIAYHVSDGSQNPTRSLYYAYSLTDTGSNLADWVTVDVTPAFLNGGQSLSLCEVDGTPAVSLYGGASAGDAFRVAYIRATTPNGASAADWHVLQPTTVGNGFGFASSMALINGHPAIAYQGPDDNTCYIYSSTVDGMGAADWSAPVVIDGSMWTSGQEVSLCELDGSPAIAYRDDEGGTTHVKFARANDATGATAGAWSGAGSSKFDLDSAFSFFPSMAVINGKPAVAWWGSANNDLRYAVASTASGAAFADWSIVNADGGADEAGVLPSLCQLNGVPVIAHQAQGAEFDLEVAVSNTALGSMQADWPADSQKVDMPGDVGGYCHMIDANGYLAIVYFENNPAFSLKYAVLFQ